MRVSEKETVGNDKDSIPTFQPYESVHDTGSSNWNK